MRFLYNYGRCYLWCSVLLRTFLFWCLVFYCSFCNDSSKCRGVFLCLLLRRQSRHLPRRCLFRYVDGERGLGKRWEFLLFKFWFCFYASAHHVPFIVHEDSKVEREMRSRIHEMNAVGISLASFLGMKSHEHIRVDYGGLQDCALCEAL